MSESTLPATIEQNGSARTPVVAGQRGLVLRTMEDMWRFAQCVSKSGLAPKGMEHPEAILIAVQMGAELGMSPMASLQNIAVINGRPSVWGDAMLAVCRASGLFDEGAFEEKIVGTGDERTGVVTVRRLPNGNPITKRFSVADAKKAGLWGKSGPWTQYPERMLVLRPRSWALRDAFADVLRGFGCVEEIQDSLMVEHGPVATPQTLDDLAEQMEEQPAIEATVIDDEAELAREAAALDAKEAAEYEKSRGKKKRDSLLPEEPELSGSRTYPE